MNTKQTTGTCAHRSERSCQPPVRLWRPGVALGTVRTLPRWQSARATTPDTHAPRRPAGGGSRGVCR